MCANHATEMTSQRRRRRRRNDALWRTRRQRTTPKNQSRFSFCFSELWPSLVFHCYKTPSLLLLLLLRLNNQFVWHKISLILEGKKKEWGETETNTNEQRSPTDWLIETKKGYPQRLPNFFSPSFAAGLLILILGCFMLRAFFLRADVGSTAKDWSLNCLVLVAVMSQSLTGTTNTSCNCSL